MTLLCLIGVMAAGQTAGDVADRLARADSAAAAEIVRPLFDGFGGDAKQYAEATATLREKLYDADSPLVNEEAYLAVVDKMLADSLLDEAELLRAEEARRTMMTNRIGHKAENFGFIGADSEKTELHSVVAKAPLTLLVFFDPDCEECAVLEHDLAGSAEIARAVAGAELSVVMICPFAVESGHWLEVTKAMPHTWSIGMADDDFEESEPFIIRKTPTVYLLDRSAMILAKNISPGNVADTVIRAVRKG